MRMSYYSRIMITYKIRTWKPFVVKLTERQPVVHDHVNMFYSMKNLLLGLFSRLNCLNERLIYVFHRFGGFNPVYEDPKSAGNVPRILFTAQDGSATLTFLPR